MSKGGPPGYKFIFINFSTGWPCQGLDKPLQQLNINSKSSCPINIQLVDVLTSIITDQLASACDQKIGAMLTSILASD